MLLLSLGACSSVRRNHTSHGKRPQTSVQIDTHKLEKTQRTIVEEAMSWLGTPYRYAGEEKGKGADCSGMVMKVFDDCLGWKLPRNSAKQAEFCEALDFDEVKPGDLVFFATGKDPDRVSHVGIMLDDCHFIHASSSKGVVISDVTTNYYTRTFMMYGRIPKKARTGNKT